MRRKSKVIHVTLTKEAGVTSVSEVTDLIKEYGSMKGATVTTKTVEYTPHVEDNFVRPKGVAIGNGAYRSVKRGAAE